MPDMPSLALARLAVKEYYQDGFQLVIVEGNARRGKTSYTLKNIDQILGFVYDRKIECSNFSKWGLKRFMGWHPAEVIETWLNKPKKKEPVFVWDDAGVWLNNMLWSDPLLIKITQYLNIVGTDYGCLIFTTPKAGWVLNKIGSFPEMIRIKIVKAMGHEDEPLQDKESIKWARKAIGYKPWLSPDLKKHGVNKVLEDSFNCKIRQDLYEYYQPLRDSYNDQIKALMRKELHNQALIRQVRDSQTQVRALSYGQRLTKLQKKQAKLEKANIDERIEDNLELPTNE